MLNLAIFTALGWERRAVVAALDAVEPAGPAAWRGLLPGDGGTCLVVQTGVGQKRAGAVAHRVPDARAFLAAGCAGGLVDWLRPGDLVVASSIVPVEADGQSGGALPADPSCVPLAAACGFRVHTGAVLSSPVLGSALGTLDAAAGEALVVEMESAAIAAEAANRGVPFVGVRVVLDVRGQTIPALDALDEATGEIRARRAVATLLGRPWLWPAVVRLARQTRTADRALRAVMPAVIPAFLGRVPAPRAVPAQAMTY